MTTHKANSQELSIEIKGFATIKPVLKADGKMALMKVGVRVNPLKCDYYNVLVFGPAAKSASMYVQKGSIVEVKGILEFSRRNGRNGKVNPKATVITNKVTFCKRGEKHHAKIEVTGELATHPYSSRTANGTDVCSFEVKTVRTRNGKERTDSVDVSAFGSRAVACKAYLYRGRCVTVRGNAHISVYPGRDGKQKASLDVQASDMEFLEHGVKQVTDAAAGIAKAA